MTKRKKPETSGELKENIELQPERSNLNGEEVVRFDRREFRGSISVELYREVLLLGGALGLSKSEILTLALSKLVSDPGLQALKQSFLLSQSQKHGVSELEVRSKIFAAYKAVGHAKKLNLSRTGEDDE